MAPLAEQIRTGVFLFGLSDSVWNVYVPQANALRRPHCVQPSSLAAPTTNEELRVSNLVLSLHEDDPDGPIEVKEIEEVFVRESALLSLVAGGQTIKTAGEHPFYVEGKGWTAARELQVGDKLITRHNETIAVEEVSESSEFETVYNVRVADYHTYFVGTEEWAWSVWAHNLKCELHHVATDKHSYWTPIFEPLFRRAGLDLQSGLNLLRVKGHQGPHPHIYHQTVFEIIVGATMRTRTSHEYRQQFFAAIAVIRHRINSVGDDLYQLVRGLNLEP